VNFSQLLIDRFPSQNRIPHPVGLVEGVFCVKEHLEFVHPHFCIGVLPADEPAFVAFVIGRDDAVAVESSEFALHLQSLPKHSCLFPRYNFLQLVLGNSLLLGAVVEWFKLENVVVALFDLDKINAIASEDLVDVMSLVLFTLAFKQDFARDITWFIFEWFVYFWLNL